MRGRMVGAAARFPMPLRQMVLRLAIRELRQNLSGVRQARARGRPGHCRHQELIGRFRTAFSRFDADLAAGTFRRGLRVKRVQGTDSIFELSWAPDGRSTFEYGTPAGEGAHVIGRRIGRHHIFGRRRTPGATIVRHE